VSSDDNDRSLSNEPSSAFDAGRYWEDMHKSNEGYAAVGFGVLGSQFNAWMYRVRLRVLRRAVRRADVAVEGATVLDCGAGTGFYVREWQRLGAETVTGVDVSSAAVERLRVDFPDAAFVVGDVADPIVESLGTGYDIVSAFDVLFHIVDDSRFVLAIQNLGRLTRPDGHLLLSENFLRGPTVRGRHQVSRTRVDIERSLRDAGFESVLRLPMFVLMNSPIDSQSWLLRTWWRLLAGVCSPPVGAILGAALFLPELALTALLQEGPSTELVVCKRR
jgi:SAM-dependent methyltransferase